MPEVVVVMVMDAADADDLLERHAVAELVDKSRIARLDPARGDAIAIQGVDYVASITTGKIPSP